MKDLNSHYCLATKEHYDKLIEDEYEDEFMYSTGDNYYVTTGNVFVSAENIPENKTPMHLHNNEWVFGSLEHETGISEVFGEAIHPSRIGLAKPKPVECVTREMLDEARDCGDMKLIQDYAYELLEYLEANQKDNK